MKFEKGKIKGKVKDRLLDWISPACDSFSFFSCLDNLLVWFPWLAPYSTPHMVLLQKLHEQHFSSGRMTIQFGDWFLEPRNGHQSEGHFLMGDDA